MPPPDASVLVVDDDPDLSDALCEVLGDAGYRVSSAVNGFEALRVLADSERLPDLILIDLMMPIMDGYEFRAAQLADPRIAGIPSIAVSAGPMDARIHTLRLAAWMAKPISVAALIGAVERHRVRRPNEPAPFAAPGGHSMLFYGSREELAGDVARYLSPAVQAGGAGVVLATGEHWRLIERELVNAGSDPAAARASGALQVLDAHEVLGELLQNGRVGERRFREVIGKVVAAAEARGPRVRAYGELVDVLWQAGEVATAVAVEQCWNRLLATARCDLHCAYAAPTTPVHRAAIDWVRQQHADSIAA